MNNLGKNKKLLLAKYPDGLAELDDFITEEVDVPVPWKRKLRS